MMIQRNFLVRQAEELDRALGQIIARLTGLKDNVLDRECVGEAYQTIQAVANVDIEKLMETPPERFVQVLQENWAMTDANLDGFATVLFYIAECTEGKERATLFYERSLLIFGYLDRFSQVYSFERSYMLERIRQVLM